MEWGALIGRHLGVGWASFEGRGCHLGVRGIVWGKGALVVGCGHHLGAEGIIWRQGALFGGGGCHLWAVGIVWQAHHSGGGGGGDRSSGDGYDMSHMINKHMLNK